MKSSFIADKPFFFTAAPQREALARLAHAVEDNLTLCWLAGRSGMGKSFVLQTFARQRLLLGDVVWQSGLASLRSSQSLLCSLLQAAGRYDIAAENPNWPALIRQLRELKADGGRFLLCIDDYAHASDDVRRLLMALPDCLPTNESPLTLILSLNETAHMAGRDYWSHRCDLQAELYAWNATEISRFAAAYAGHHVGSGVTFSSAALQTLAHVSGGLPAELSRIMAAVFRARGRRPGVVHREEILQASNFGLLHAA